MSKKKIALIISSALIIISLAGCQGKTESSAYELYSDSYRAEFFLENNPEYVYDEALLTEAEEVAKNKDKSLEERFKAIDLLCEAEYLRANEEEKVSRDDFLYPTSSLVAGEVFAEIENGNSDEFWNTLNDFSARKELLYAAAPGFSPDTVLKLYEEGEKADDYINMYLSDIVARSLKTNTTNLYTLAEIMFKNGYFERDSYHAALDIFVNGTANVKTVDEGLEYVAFFAETALPLLEHHYPDSSLSWRSPSNDGETSYFTPGLRITLSEDAIDQSHLQTEGADAPAAITSGKVIALIANGSQDEYPEIGTAPVLDGDFLLNLPKEKRPAALAEVDYVVSITSMYENVGEYKDRDSGKSVSEKNPIYAIASYSYISINDWRTGDRLGTYGTVESDAPNTIVVANGNSSGREYAFAPYPSAKDIYQAVEAYL